MLPWLKAFLFTQIVEVPIYLLGFRGAQVSSARRALAAFGATALTHPVVWFVLPVVFGGFDYWLYVGVAEAFAVGVEALYLRTFGMKRALLWAFLANAASVALGLGARYAFGWV